MKKKLFAVLLAALLFMGAASAQSSTLVDGFEDNDLTEWACDPNDGCDSTEFATTSDQAFEGFYSMEYIHDGDNNDHYYRNITNGSTTGGSFSFYSSVVDSTSHTFRFINNEGSNYQWKGQAHLGGTGPTTGQDVNSLVFYYPSEDSDILAEGQLNTNEWYDFQVHVEDIGGGNYNWTAELYNNNDNLVDSGYSIETENFNVTAFDTGSAAPESYTAYIDNIETFGGMFTDLNPEDGANRGFENVEFSHTITAPEGGANITGITLYYPNGTKYGDFDDSVDLTEGETYNHSETINFNSTMPEGAWQWTATASDFDTGDLYTSGNRTLNIDGDNADLNFTLDSPANNTDFNNGETVDFNASVTAPEGVTLEDAQIQYFTDTGSSGTITQQQNVDNNTVTLTGSETFNENANYTWYATALPEGAGTYQDSSESYFTVTDPDFSINYTLNNPVDGATIGYENINFSGEIETDTELDSADIELFNPSGTSVAVMAGQTSVGPGTIQLSEQFNFDGDNDPEGTWTWRLNAFVNGTEYSSDPDSFTLDGDSVNLGFTLNSPADNSEFNTSESISFDADISSPDGVEIVDPQIQYFTDTGSGGTIVTGTDAENSVSLTSTESFNESANYTWYATAVPEGGSSYQDSSERNFTILETPDEPIDPAEGIAQEIGAKIAAFISNIFGGFFDGIENNVSEANQTLIASMLAIIIAVITAVLTRSSIIGIGSMMLTILGFVVNGWIPSWIGFVFITLTAAVLALIAGRVVGGG